MSLNAKQKIFVAEYLVDGNATRAAKAAGYSAKTAGQMGFENLKKPEIAAEIEKGIRRRELEAEVRAAKNGITKERWLEELTMIATANMDDHAQVVKTKHRNGSHGRTYEVVTVSPALASERPRELGRVIKKLSETKNGIGIELHSKQAALELLGKHFGWVKDKIEHSGPDGGPQVVVMLPPNGREAVIETPNTTDTAPIEGQQDAIATTGEEE